MFKIKQIAPNQTEVYRDNVIVFVSYETPVAAKFLDSKRALETENDYSRTTTKHIKAWLINEDNVEVVPQKEIERLMQ